MFHRNQIVFTSSVKRVSKKFVNLITASLFFATTLVGAAPMLTQSAHAASTLTVCSSGCPYYDLNTAVAAASDGDTIELTSNLTTSSQVLVNKSITLNGNGNTISPSFVKTSSENAAITVTASNVTISNLIVDGNGSLGLHGLNIYKSTGVNLNNVSIKNFSSLFSYGLVVNGSIVTATNLSTSGNFASADVDQGSGVTMPSILKMIGSASLQDQFLSGIYVDNATKSVSVQYSANQFVVSHPGYHPSDALYSLNQGSSLPATTTVVTPGNMHSWVGIDDNGNGGSLNFVKGPSTAPLGAGSAELKVSSTNQGYMLAAPEYSGVKLSNIAELSYSTFVQIGNDTISPSVQLDITSSPTNTSWQGRLVYEPYMNGTVTDGQWQTWQAAQGKWWLSHSAQNFGGNCGQANPCTFAQLIALYPDIAISTSQPLIGFKAGSSWTDFAGNVDALRLATTTTNDVYDFEPDVTPPSTPVASPAGGNYSSSQTVTLSSSDTGSGLAGIFYTIDGSTPTSSSAKYTAPITIASNTTLKAVAYDNAGNASPLMVQTYTIKTAPGTSTPSNPNAGAPEPTQANGANGFGPVNQNIGQVLGLQTTTPNTSENTGNTGILGTQTQEKKAETSNTKNTSGFNYNWLWLLLLLLIPIVYFVARKSSDNNN